MSGTVIELVASVGGPAAGWVFAGLGVWLVLTGRLIPRRTYLDQQQAARHWEDAFRAERERTEKIIEPTARLQRDVLRALPMEPKSTDSDPAGSP